jgi:aspartate racemase
MPEKIIGIIGGIGPYAGLDLVQKIYNNTLAENDNEHLPVILHSVPQLITDRTDYITGKNKENPSTGIIQAIKNLINAGANTLAIACNAAHSPSIFNPVREWIENKPGIELVSLVDSALEFVMQFDPPIKKVGLLAVYGTYKSRVYEDLFLKNGVDVIETDEKMQRYIHNIIWDPAYGIKSNSHPVTDKARQELLIVTGNLIGQGADAIILACTEIPLAITERRISDVLIIDANEILARKLIRCCNPDKLSPVEY